MLRLVTACVFAARQRVRIHNWVSLFKLGWSLASLEWTEHKRDDLFGERSTSTHADNDKDSFDSCNRRDINRIQSGTLVGALSQP